jgi:hypothetical protein
MAEIVGWSRGRCARRKAGLAALRPFAPCAPLGKPLARLADADAGGAGAKLLRLRAQRLATAPAPCADTARGEA